MERRFGRRAWIPATAFGAAVLVGVSFTGVAGAGSSSGDEHLVTLYQTGLRAAGYQQVTDKVFEQFGHREREMRFELAATPETTEIFSLGPSRAVQVTIVDDDNLDHQLYFSEPVTDDHLEVFSGWHDGIPVPDGGTIASADLSAYPRPDGDVAVNIDTIYRYDDTDPERLEDEFESALPTGGLAIEPGRENEPGRTVMAGGEFDRPTATFLEGYPSGALLAISTWVYSEPAADP